MSELEYVNKVSDPLARKSKEFDLGLEVGFRAACETHTALNNRDITERLQALKDFLADPDRAPMSRSMGHKVPAKIIGEL
jgi:hypothetical protein